MKKMNKFVGFSDLCVPNRESIKELKDILLELIDLGYKNVAIEQVYDHINAGGDRKSDLIPKPVDLSSLNKDLNGRLRLLNRLTIIYADASVMVALSRSANLRGYNLVAAIPTTEEAFQHACQTLNCDILSYNSTTVRNKMSRKFYYVAVNRGIMFEIKYAPAIVDSSDRKDLINRANRYHSYGKSKNVIISSEARNRFQVRGPYDIANLGLIFGLSEEQSKNAILALPRKILIAAETRRYGKAGVVVGYRQNAVDSDDYSDTELNETISDSDTEEDEISHSDVEMAEPPVKFAKYDE
ncbi:ribonuclease P protein subunit p30 [Uranotaenia lowii]|uniref:ribonuclease P protein subunit p30 n=1 Tax=Uranotaenia lowii TaxID=190385 RepID=UPI0024791BE7|nr:ribonuclease P protein subunit p30 [Uranotaenia lowii]